MALINVAAILVGRGRRVLAIDLDLEAPGISYLLQQKHAGPTAGFVDLLSDVFLEKAESAMANVKDPQAILRYTHILDVPEEVRSKPGGGLMIMPAGRLDADYERKRQAIDLHRLYQEGKGKSLMMRLRELIISSRQFDYVLIDSRTGFSDEAGISIRDLGDHLLILHGLNSQNIEGTARVIEQIRKTLAQKRRSNVSVPSGVRLDDGSRETSVRKQNVEIDFVASPVPIGEDIFRRRRIEEANDRFTSAWGKLISVRLSIPYHPRLALDDEPVLFHQTEGGLYLAYMAIEERVREMSGDTTAIWSTRAQEAIAAGNHEDAIQYFREAADLGAKPTSLIMSACSGLVGKEEFTAYWKLLEELSPGRNPLELLVGIQHFEQQRRYEDVENLYREAIERYPADESFKIPFANFLRRYRNKPQEAAQLYRRALERSPENVTLLSDLAGLLWRSLGMQDEAEGLLRTAIKNHPHNARLLSHLANLLWYARSDYEQAEELFEDAYRLQSNDEIVVGRLANFLWKVKKDFARAERLYAKAVNLTPDDGDNLCNYAGFLLAQRRDTEQMLLRAWAVSFNRRDQTTAEIAFYRGVQLRIIGKQDTLPLSYLKTLLRLEFPRMPWSFEEVLRIAGEKFTAQIFDLYRTLAAAILDPSRLQDLERSPHWRELKEQPISDDI